MAIDLNADVGESFGRWVLGDDASVLSAVTSANVACGFHAGDPPTLRRTCVLAVQHGVAIGAQVGYRDLAGFGRRFIDLPPGDLRDDVLYQLGALDAFARAAGGSISYLKPHGALYQATADRADQAQAVVDALVEFADAHDLSALAVLGPPDSMLLAAAEQAGLVAVPEAFADRAYTPRGRLVPRGQPGAVIAAPSEVADRAVQLATHHEVVAVDGTVVPLRARSICLHGDTPGAAQLAHGVRAALEEAGVAVAAFAAV